MEEQRTPKRRSLQDRLIPIAIGVLALLISCVLFFDLSESAVIERETIVPYVACTQWKTLIVRDRSVSLSAGWTGALSIGDRVRTLAASSATVFWPDGSVTRLWEKSSIRIHEMGVGREWYGLQVDFSLTEGRTWSNIVTPLIGDSHFHERYNDDTVIATVRGTVFEIDLGRSYIHTIDHAIEIINTHSGAANSTLSAWGISSIIDGRPLDHKVLDEAWNALNKQADVAHINARLEHFNQNVLRRFGQKNYFDILLEKIGIRSATTLPTDALLHGDETSWQSASESIRKTEITHRHAVALYEEIANLPGDEGMQRMKSRLRSLIVATAPSDQKSIFADSFARATLYDLWSLGTSAPAENMNQLQKQLEEYIRLGADRGALDRLEQSFRDKSLSEWKDSVQSVWSKTLEHLQQKNYFDEIITPIDSKKIDTVNDRATEVREGLWDQIRNILWR